MITVDKLIEDRCVATPLKPAIRHNGRVVNYQTVNELSNQLARYLIAQGIKPGDNVAVAVSRSPEMVILLLAVIKAGATYLPLDIKFPVGRIKYMLDDAAVKAIITLKEYKPLYLDSYKVICLEEALKAAPSQDASSFPTLVTEDTIAYILYTSGSTGNPKGVEVKHSGLVNLLQSVQKEPGMTADDVMLHTTTISFDIAELEVYLPLITGGQLVIADAELVKDGRALLEIAIAEGITIMQGTPFMWRTMLEVGWLQRLPIKIFCGGEAMTKDLAQKLVVRCNELWNMYGPTETTIYSIIKKVGMDDEVITIGHPIDNTDVYILDEQLKPVIPGEVGEIYIGGDGVAVGYINKPELTEERFITDHISTTPGKMMYKSGDLGKLLPNGEILCLGRIDHQIKIRGYRIETEEIEYQLKQNDDVKQALIILHKDTHDQLHLVAYVVPEDMDSITDEAAAINRWKGRLLEQLPEYMVPHAYMIIGAIPLMPNGKTDRGSLPEPVMNKYVSDEYQEASTKTEQKLTEIAAQHIDVDKIGVNDKLCELGINSLLGVSIMVRIEKLFGKRLPISTLLSHPTIKDLASLIDEPGLHAQYKTLVPLKPGGKKIPVYIIHGIGLNLFNVNHMVSQLSADQPVFGIQSIGLDGTMEVPATMEEIAAFYISEVLRNDPVGPYAFAGYSFGGYIGFEMVKQLKEMGKDVRLLAMFDTNVQLPTHRYPMSKKLGVKIGRQFGKFFHRIRTIFDEPVELIKFLRVNNTARFKIWLNKIGIIKHYDREHMPDFMHAIAVKLNTAYYNYVLKPYHVKVDIYRAKRRFYYVDDRKTLGWKPYALDGVQVHVVPGDHKEMFDESNAKVLADIFQKRLDEINS
ncbi:non-ribosomal peptide synthetase [Mucilaginibacter myungsuensis]|uniref:Amino acid adenylation domain-containing protein n=1 Tax=Mucilaginibacter myungsuensis TaxID=649104 RepID=A0A929PW28_9SPHI|nr:amino acid adenylation domain-containing protein [Mucilaginibacter myungsuensis]MBE9661641.1 amino acid adenylation domain-containing protein [Mucilaginibacter myungsuensis]MDN3597785.1 amino acid adenylation domain-containing protein [Mucilaginibacter myungsuensis]